MQLILTPECGHCDGNPVMAIERYRLAHPDYEQYRVACNTFAILSDVLNETSKNAISYGSRSVRYIRRRKLIHFAHFTIGHTYICTDIQTKGQTCYEECFP